MEKNKSLGQLAELVDGHVIGSSQTLVSDVTHDSRQAGEGVLFVAIEGENFDGHRFVGEAEAAGAAAACVAAQVETGIPLIVVGDTRAALGRLAAAVHGNPSTDLDVIGITGTNGKTTVAHYVESMLTSSGIPTGLIGTVGSRAMGEVIPSVRTTPEASDFQRLLALMVDRGVEKVAVEVSSHALELDRVTGTTFEVAAFTNFSQDHLDFHGTMDDYKAAKSKLFSDYQIGTAVFNTDDPVGQEFSSHHDGPQITVGRTGDLALGSVDTDSGGSSLELSFEGRRHGLETNVLGEFNVSNLVVALACCLAVGVELDALLEAAREMAPVPGRFERIEGVGPTVVVDYAHSPDAISKAVATARNLTQGRVIVVIGAGGDRDRDKRGPMGRAASAADLVVVTSDNPRSEDPERILDQILVGVSVESARIEDRDAAIGAAISQARQGDVVLVLGKGHERGQERDGEILPFDDREVARTHMLDNSSGKSTKLPDESGSIGP